MKKEIFEKIMKKEWKKFILFFYMVYQYSVPFPFIDAIYIGVVGYDFLWQTEQTKENQGDLFSSCHFGKKIEKKTSISHD